MKKRAILSTVLSLAAMTLFGCGGGGGGGGGTAPAPAGSTTISGVAAKGPISGGVVKVFAIKTDGTVDRTAEIGSGTSDGTGAFTVSIPSDKKPAGPVLVEVSSGSFTDEASGTPGVPLKTTLQAAVSGIVDGDKIAVTPLTHLAVKQVEGIGTFSKQEIDDANLQVGRFFEVGDIIKSLPFDPTKDAPTGASDDQKKYASALGVFSQLCNSDSRKGASKLEDALVAVLDDLGQELKDNGGFLDSTRTEFNVSITTFNDSGKNKGGIKLTPIVFTGGVLQLKTAGSLQTNTVIEAIDLTIKLPAGVSVNLDPVNSANGELAAGVVVPVSNAVEGSLVTAKFDAAAGTLHIILINVKPGIKIGEFAHLEFIGPPPPAADFVVTVNRLDGGSSIDPNASFIDLNASGITITKTVAGL